MYAKRSAKLIISLACYAIGAPLRVFGRFVGVTERARGIVLYYHGVTAKQLPRFRRQMNYLKQRAHVVRLADLLDGTALGRSVCITFDDALDSVRTRAAPVLQELGMPATVFAVSGNLGLRPGWEMPSGHPDAEETLMTADQLQELAPLVDVGSHTVTHPELSSIPLEQVGFEMSESKRELEARLGTSIDLLSAPYGDFDRETLRCARDAGYRHMLSCEPEVFRPDRTRFEIGRFKVTPDDWGIEFRLKCAGAYAWLGGVRRILRLRVGDTGVSAASNGNATPGADDERLKVSPRRPAPEAATARTATR